MTKHLVQLDFADFASLPTSGEDNVIYQTLDDGVFYMFENGEYKTVLEKVTAFEDLTDTFTFAGNELETVRVNAAGTALETYTPSTSSTGRFGIADSNGAYTYYTTLTLAMAAASSGKTIEFFTDYTETGAVTITCKDGVTINGNGHTYTCTSAGAGLKLFDNVTNGKCNIFKTKHFL